MEKYPKNISLHKLSTLKDAFIPQEEKYPSGMEMGKGHMWSHTVPKVGDHFFLHSDKINANFRTSPVNKIIEKTSDHIIFETWNSTYKIEIHEA